MSILKKGCWLFQIEDIPSINEKLAMAPRDLTVCVTEGNLQKKQTRTALTDYWGSCVIPINSLCSK